MVNLYAGWLAIVAGLIGGAAIGLFFHDEAWLGGYSSWRRRMLRLAHISLLGTGLLNLAFALSCAALRLESFPRGASTLFLLGAAAMPTVCALSAWRAGFRHWFFVPVVCLTGATLDFMYRGLLR